MATAKRLSYSLLISTLAFAVFAVVAFSGLFPWIEAQFYSPKVVSELQGRLDKTALLIDAWKNSTVEKLDKVLGDGAFDGVFGPTASQVALQKRYQNAKLFLMGIRGGGSLRVLNGDRTQIHFSTEDEDVKVKTDLGLTYRPVAELSGMPDLKSAGTDGKIRVLTDSEGRTVWFLRSWKDTQGLVPGYVLMGVSLEDLRLTLVESGLALADQPFEVLTGEDYLFSLLGRKTDGTLLSRVRELRGQGVMPPVQRVARADGQITLALVHRNALNLLVPASTLELDPLLKGLLLVSFYSVIFLVTFLLANLRGEPLSVVTRKVKRFQLQVVKQYLDLKEVDKIQSLRDELARHSDEIRTDIRRSLGPVRRRDREWVDRYIDTSWQEVMDLLRGPTPPSESSSNADWKRLETLLQQALTQGRFVVSDAQPSRPEPIPQKLRPSSDELEELDNVEELDDEVEVLASEEVEDAEDAEELDEGDLEEIEEVEAVDAVEELEELEEAESFEGVESPAMDVVTSVGEPEVLEELEDAEDGDEPGTGVLEELPTQDGTSGLFRTRDRSGRSPVTLLASDQEEDDIEELDELEEVFEEVGPPPGGEDFSYSLEKLDAAWKAPADGVFDESEDLITLTDEVFASADSGSDEFGDLVNEVLAGPAPRFSTLDEDHLVPTRLSREWRWTGAGFDWDRFALGVDEVNLFRALSEIVAEFDAFTAAILTDQEGHWKAQSSVGFSDAGKTVLDFGPLSPLAKAFLSIRALHVINGGTAHPVLRDSFHAKDMKFLKSVLCVPLLFRREPAWLILGLRREPGDLMTLLAPRRVG